MLWIMNQHRVQHAMHYWGDFLVLGPAGSDGCGEALAECLRLCQELGVAVAPHKTEGPSTQIAFHGIVIDTERLVAPNNRSVVGGGRKRQRQNRSALVFCQLHHGRRRCEYRVLVCSHSWWIGRGRSRAASVNSCL